LPHSRSDVGPGHGNYAPYKYDLSTFSPGGHRLEQSDPSIGTVMTSPSKPRVPRTRIVIFTGGWAVRNTFRPPWYHMKHHVGVMGLITAYTTQSRTVLSPAAILATTYEPHCPDRQEFDQDSNGE